MPNDFLKQARRKFAAYERGSCCCAFFYNKLNSKRTYLQKKRLGGTTLFTHWDDLLAQADSPKKAYQLLLMMRASLQTNKTLFSIVNQLISAAELQNEYQSNWQDKKTEFVIQVNEFIKSNFPSVPADLLFANSPSNAYYNLYIIHELYCGEDENLKQALKQSLETAKTDELVKSTSISQTPNQLLKYKIKLAIGNNPHKLAADMLNDIERKRCELVGSFQTSQEKTTTVPRTVALDELIKHISGSFQRAKNQLTNEQQVQYETWFMEKLDTTKPKLVAKPAPTPTSPRTGLLDNLFGLHSTKKRDSRHSSVSGATTTTGNTDSALSLPPPAHKSTWSMFSRKRT